MFLTPLATTEDLRRWDADSIALGLPEFTLMENAARAALNVLQKEALQKNIPALAGRRVLLFMGGGNNGGDAACLARHLRDAGAHTLVLHTKALGKLTGAARQHAHFAKACGVIFCRLPAKPESALARLDSAWQIPEIIVDGLLGTGFSGVLRSPMTHLVRHINSCGANGAFVFALDVPSGLNAMTGRPCPDSMDSTDSTDSTDSVHAVRANATATFAAATPGLVLPEARQYTGTLHICDIGIPRVVREAILPSYFVLNAGCTAHTNLQNFQLCHSERSEESRMYWRDWILRYAQNDAHGSTHYNQHFLNTADTPHAAHKNRFGHALVIGGAAGMAGAAHLTARAVLRSGAGLVTVAAPAVSIPGISAQLPEAMTVSCGVDSWPDSIDGALHTAIAKATVLIIGPGMGQTPACKALLGDILRLPERPPVVCDADALNILAAAPELFAVLRKDDICTPHPAEAARLLMAETVVVQQDRFAALRALCDTAPCVFVLKGAGTLIGQGIARDGGQGRGPVYIAPWNIPTLAVAGSGDVLAGCIGALYARALSTGGAVRMAACEAAVLAVAAHARAGMLCAGRYPARGVLAGEIADTLPTALASLDQLS